jgi:outer membrane receptor for ferrienterochelin and colicin
MAIRICISPACANLTVCRVARIFLVSLALLLAAQARADTAEEAELDLAFGDKAFISIATGQQQPLRLAPAVTSVVTAAEIKAVGATTLDEALALVPGLHDAPSPFNRLNPNWSIRGPGSAVHGADAFAGMINVITRSPGALPTGYDVLDTLPGRGIWFELRHCL